MIKMSKIILYIYLVMFIVKFFKIGVVEFNINDVVVIIVFGTLAICDEISSLKDDLK